MRKKILNFPKKDFYDFMFLFFISLTIVFLFSFDYLNEDNCNYAIEEIHHFNNRIFEGNINTVGIESSPRYYANAFMGYLIKIFNSNWFEASLFLIRINYLLYALVATFSTIKFFKKNKFISVFIISLFLMTPSISSIGFELNGAPDVFLGTAIPISFLALILVLGRKKYWLTAWIFVTISTFLHIHEGFWAAFILGIIWLSDSFSYKKINFRVFIYIFLYLFFLLLIVIPSLNNAQTVDNNYFTQIYVYIRTPHHLLLSYIGKWEISKAMFLLFFINFIQFTDILKYRKYREIKRILFLICFLSFTYILLHIVHYLSTEFFNIPFIITMYIPKCFKFFAFLAILNYIILGLRKLEKGIFLEGILLLAIPFISDFWRINISFVFPLILFIVFLILKIYKTSFFTNNYYYKKVIIFFLYLFIFFLVHIKQPLFFNKFKFIYLGILIYEFILPFIKRKYIALIIIFSMFFYSLYMTFINKFFYLSKKKYHYISGLKYAQNAISPEIYELAVQFKNITTEDQAFLADPYSAYSNYFQLFSERNCYALYKNIPSQKHVIIEWYERILKANIINTGNDLEIKKFLEDTNLEYILLSSDKFYVVDNSPHFIKIINNDAYGIFKLKRSLK